MSSSNFDPRSARYPGPEPKAWDADPKVPQSPPAFAAAAPRAEPRPAAEPAPVATGSVFGPTLRFKGELHAEEDFVLQGQIEGSIHHTQSLTIGTDGVVTGDSRARIIIVDGTVNGDLYALESITIRPTAKVQGNLLAPRVAIADGASFNGKVDMASAARAVRTIAERQSSTLEEDAAEQLLVSGQRT